MWANMLDKFVAESVLTDLNRPAGISATVDRVAYSENVRWNILDRFVAFEVLIELNRFSGIVAVEEFRA